VFQSQSSVTEAQRPTRRRTRCPQASATFKRQPTANSLGDEGPGRRSRKATDYNTNHTRHSLAINQRQINPTSRLWPV